MVKDFYAVKSESSSPEIKFLQQLELKIHLDQLPQRSIAFLGSNYPFMTGFCRQARKRCQFFVFFFFFNF